MSHALLSSSLWTIATIVVAMATLSVLETIIAFQPRNAWSRAHLGPNLSLTALTIFTNLPANIALVSALVWAEGRGFGLFRALGLGPVVSDVLSIAGLDLSFYLLHVAMHRVPAFWRFHRVHHSDPMVDVTTTIRQHPGESILRYSCLALAALLLGSSPAAFAIYRVASVIGGLLEHANIRLPRRLSVFLSAFTTWPDFHKTHHAEELSLSSTNYGNLFSWWDRLFSTFTPVGAPLGEYGIAHAADRRTQSIVGLLLFPFRQLEAGKGSR